MDSISQIVLGATLSLVVTRGKQPKKAILYGAALGTLPDLDVLIPSANDLTATIEHRTWSHSWVVMSLISPAIAALIHWKDRSFSYLCWLCLVWLTLVTHSALDGFTIYGTDVFWPFADQTLVGGSVFIIDPLFTLPLLTATVLGFRLRKKQAHNGAILRISSVALLLSSAYLGWGLYAQHRVQEIATRSLAEQSVSYTHLIATPTPFNSLLWRVVVMDEDQYHEGYYSFFDPAPIVKFNAYDRGKTELALLATSPDWQRFDHFSHGFNKAETQDQTLIGSDLRMGAEPFYFFRFVFAEIHGEKITSMVPYQPTLLLEDFSLLSKVWARIWSQDAL